MYMRVRPPKQPRVVGFALARSEQQLWLFGQLHQASHMLGWCVRVHDTSSGVRYGWSAQSHLAIQSSTYEQKSHAALVGDRLLFLLRRVEQQDIGCMCSCAKHPRCPSYTAFSKRRGPAARPMVHVYGLAHLKTATTACVLWIVAALFESHACITHESWRSLMSLSCAGGQLNNHRSDKSTADVCNISELALYAARCH